MDCRVKPGNDEREEALIDGPQAIRNTPFGVV
jgi:hypothetical protein